MKPGRHIQRIIISRTDSIGDVILTLPLTGLIKAHWPEAEIMFLGKDYTMPILQHATFVDQAISLDQLMEQGELKAVEKLRSFKADAILHVFPRKPIARLAWKAQIPYRFGSTGRLYHYLYCNRLIPLSRKRSPLHEASLNAILLKGLGIKNIPQPEGLPAYYGLNAQTLAGINRVRLHHPAVILHPGSKGSAREWDMAHFHNLSLLLNQQGYHVYLTGTEAEGAYFRPWLCQSQPWINDLSGKLTLEELFGFIAAADALVAASTGPLHMAAALGKLAIGIYPPIRPMHPGRWRPLGENSHYLVVDKACSDCRTASSCACMQAVRPEEVYALICKHLPIAS